MVTSSDSVLACMRAVGEDLLAARLSGLTPRERVYLSLAAEVCLSPGAMEAIVADAGRHGITSADLRAVIRFVAYEAGYSQATAAMLRLNALAPHADDPAAARAMADAAAEDVDSLPDFARAKLTKLDPRFGELMTLESRMRRDHLTTLSVRERAFISMTADIMYQTLGDTFRIHTMRALRAGVDHETVRAVACYAARFGVTRAWSALDAMNTFLPDAA